MSTTDVENVSPEQPPPPYPAIEPFNELRPVPDLENSDPEPDNDISTPAKHILILILAITTVLYIICDIISIAVECDDVELKWLFTGCLTLKYFIVWIASAWLYNAKYPNTNKAFQLTYAITTIIELAVWLIYWWTLHEHDDCNTSYRIFTIITLILTWVVESLITCCYWRRIKQWFIDS